MKKKALLALMAAGTIAVATGCGGGNTGSTTTGGNGNSTSGNTTGQGDSSALSQAKSAVAAAEGMPTIQSVGTPIDMSKLKGKNVWVLTSALNIPFVASIVTGVKQAAAKAGIKLTVLDGQGNPAKWNSDLNEAVTEHAAAIISVAASPQEMTGGMKAVKAAGIPLIDVLTADEKAPLVPGTFSHVSISFYKSGELQADYVIAQSGGKGDVLIFSDNEFPGEVTRVQGMEHEFKKFPGIKVTVQDTQVGSLATQLPNLTQTELRRDPNIKWVLPTYDAQAVYIVPAIKQMGLASTVKVVSSDAVPSNLSWVQSGNVEIADVGEPDIWTGWAALDEIARAMLGKPAVNEQIPLRMFVQSNLKGANTSNENALWGGGYTSEYLKLWGLK